MTETDKTYNLIFSYLNNKAQIVADLKAFDPIFATLLTSTSQYSFSKTYQDSLDNALTNIQGIVLSDQKGIINMKGQLSRQGVIISYVKKIKAAPKRFLRRLLSEESRILEDNMNTANGVPVPAANWT